MLVTMLVLVAIYAGIVALLIIVGVAAEIVVGIAAVVALVQLLTSHGIALAALGAKEVSPAERPALHAVIERLCVQADMPKPRVGLVHTHAPNAFTVGRSRKNVAVCVTTGLLRLLSPAELEGVVAHELSHVANRDVAVMTVVSFPMLVAARLARFSVMVGERGFSFGALVVMVLGLLCSGAAWLVSDIPLQMLSRYREFAADRGAAIITGRPSAISSALLKISSTMSRIPSDDLRSLGDVKAFCILPPGQSMGGIFATHPPIEKRIAALSHLEAQLQQTA